MKARQLRHGWGRGGSGRAAAEPWSARRSTARCGSHSDRLIGTVPRIWLVHVARGLCLHPVPKRAPHLQELHRPRPGRHALLDGWVGQPHAPELVLACRLAVQCGEGCTRQLQQLGTRGAAGCIAACARAPATPHQLHARPCPAAANTSPRPPTLPPAPGLLYTLPHILSSVCQQVFSASSCPGCAFFMSTSSARIFSPTAGWRGPGWGQQWGRGGAALGAQPAPGGVQERGPRVRRRQAPPSTGLMGSLRFRSSSALACGGGRQGQRAPPPQRAQRGRADRACGWAGLWHRLPAALRCLPMMECCRQACQRCLATGDTSQIWPSKMHDISPASPPPCAAPPPSPPQSAPRAAPACAAARAGPPLHAAAPGEGEEAQEVPNAGTWWPRAAGPQACTKQNRC